MSRQVSGKKIVYSLSAPPFVIDRIRVIIFYPKNPRVKTLHKIAIAFSMTLSEFLDFEELNEYSFDEDEDQEKNTSVISKITEVFFIKQTLIFR